MKTKLIVMAGGRGERFWPKSRAARPKQFASITSDLTMTEETVARFRDRINLEDIYISSGERYRSSLGEILPEVLEENYILEPMGKDTAACICLASLSVRADPDDVLFFVPADHHISDRETFCQNLENALGFFSSHDGLLLFGIKPTHPSESYGYLEVEPFEGSFLQVRSFREKPDEATARSYLIDNRYLWNSGMFFFRKPFILETFRKLAPDHYEKVLRYLEEKDRDRKKAMETFASIDAISFDYAIAEKLRGKTFCATAGFDWNDVGSWSALPKTMAATSEGNLIRGDVFVSDCSNVVCLNDTRGKTLVLSGLRDTHVIHDGEVLYITSRSSENDIKKILKRIEKSRPELL